MNIKLDDLKVKVNKERNDFMYITETTENVRKLIEKIELSDKLTKTKILIYLFNLLNNNQINEKNETNPDIYDDIKILNVEYLGLEGNECTIILQRLATLYNEFTNTKDAYEESGIVLGIEYTSEEQEIESNFEKLSFNEKLDIYSEIIIRCDNDTFYGADITGIILGFNSSGFDIAKAIQDLKK